MIKNFAKNLTRRGPKAGSFDRLVTQCARVLRAKPVVSRQSLVALISLIDLAGCSTALVSQALPEQDSRAKAFEPVTDCALVYVYRGSIIGGDYTTNVVLDEKSVATGARSRFNVLLLKPGTYKIGATSFLYFEKAREALNLGAGDIVYLQEVFQFGSGFALQRRTAAQAQPAILGSKLTARTIVNDCEPEHAPTPQP